MYFFTAISGRSAAACAVALALLTISALAQTETNGGLPAPGEMTATNLPPVAAPTPAPTNQTTPPAPATAPSTPPATPPPAPTLPSLSVATPDATASSSVAHAANPGWPLLAALIALAAVAGFVLYYSGMTRARNCSHTSTLLLVAAVFALIGYWAGGFAVQTGGVGDPHAALGQAFTNEQRSALDHELGWTVSGGHYWGLMGSSGFFLTTPDASSRNSAATLFLMQAALMVIAVTAALGACLERGRLLAYAVAAFVIGVMIYPLYANWVWGGGWLAELGREYGLGHGFIDMAGSAVVHETAGTLALVIALLLGPRQGRFTGKTGRMTIPGHHVPFIILGAIILLLSLMAVSAVAGAMSTVSDASGSGGALAAMNTLLGAAAGLLVTAFAAGWSRRRPEPAFICRGLLGGAVATVGGGVLFEPWAAFLVGAVGGLVVVIALALLDRMRIDDPSGAAAVHGAAGAWGVIATGLLANGAVGDGLNGVAGPIRGVIYSGEPSQLVAQLIGALACFVVVFILGYAFLGLVHKILHSRVDAAEEWQGLDWSETGSLGYQPDFEPDLETEVAPASPAPKPVDEPKKPETPAEGPKT